MIKNFFKRIFDKNASSNTDKPPRRSSTGKKTKKEQTSPRPSPKETATKRKEPWVDVINFNVNKDDIRHGFYELDWNDFFIVQLKKEGYGFDGDPDEEIVSRWFRDVCINAAAEEGIDMTNRATGIIDINSILNTKKN